MSASLFGGPGPVPSSGGDEAADGHGRVEGASAYRPALRFSEDEAISEPRNVKKLLKFCWKFYEKSV